MSEMDLHGDTETELTVPSAPQPPEDLEDVEVPEVDAVEKAAEVADPEPDHEVVPVDEDEYR